MDNTKCPIALPYYYQCTSPAENYYRKRVIIRRLSRIFDDPNSSISCIAIVGPGGVGKTELVKKYVNENGKNYDIIIFFVAENLDDLTKKIYEVAKTFKLNIERQPIGLLVNTFYNALSKWGRTLIIFDNVEDPKSFKTYLPCNSKSLQDKMKICITSKWKEWCSNSTKIFIETLSLQGFTSKEAYKFVEKGLKNENLYTQSDIKALIRNLKCLPLALKQAVTYIKNQNERLKYTDEIYSLADYLKDYEKKKKELLTIWPLNDNWEITIKKYESNIDSTLAIEILKMIAYILPDNIPFKKIFDLEKSPLNNRAIWLLENYSLVIIKGENLNVHPLLQEAIKIRTENKENCVKKILLILLKMHKNETKSLIIEHLREVLKTAVQYENILKDLKVSPLIILTQDKNCDFEIVKKMSEYEMNCGNYNNLKESLKMSIKRNNYKIITYLWSLIEKQLSKQNIDDLLSLSFKNGNAEIINYFLDKIAENHNDLGVSPVMLLFMSNFQIFNRNIKKGFKTIVNHYSFGPRENWKYENKTLFNVKVKTKELCFVFEQVNDDVSKINSMSECTISNYPDLTYSHQSTMVESTKKIKNLKFIIRGKQYK